jgi:hypothetical protein
VDELGVVLDVASPQRDLEKETQRRDGVFEGGTPTPLLARCSLVAAHILEARCVGRPAEEYGQVLLIVRM